MEQEAKIFLSEQRGITQSQWLRSYNTFNFGRYHSPYKAAVEQLYVLNDDTLAGNKSLLLTIEKETMLLLLPVAGAIEYSDSSGNETIITAGQFLTAGLAPGNHYQVKNPYPEELVNVMQLWINAEHIHISSRCAEYDFDYTQRDQFATTQLASGVQLHIGKFSGRKKASIAFSNNSTCFAFVIEGAFELEERLLQSRDGLALWNTNNIEMEALSNDAIILVLEMQ